MPGQHTEKQKRQAKHVAEFERKRGKSPEEAERIGWATVNSRKAVDLFVDIEKAVPATDADSAHDHSNLPFGSRRAEAHRSSAAYHQKQAHALQSHWDSKKYDASGNYDGSKMKSGEHEALKEAVSLHKEAVDDHKLAASLDKNEGWKASSKSAARTTKEAHDAHAKVRQFDDAAEKSAAVAKGPHKDKIPGGKADEKKPKDFDQDELDEGRKHEKEHTDDPSIATEIAMDHLVEDPKYYTRLKRVEKADLEAWQKAVASLDFLDAIEKGNKNVVSYLKVHQAAIAHHIAKEEYGDSSPQAKATFRSAQIAAKVHVEKMAPNLSAKAHQALATAHYNQANVGAGAGDEHHAMAHKLLADAHRAKVAYGSQIGAGNVTSQARVSKGDLYVVEKALGDPIPKAPQHKDWGSDKGFAAGAHKAAARAIAHAPKPSDYHDDPQSPKNEHVAQAREASKHGGPARAFIIHTHAHARSMGYRGDVSEFKKRLFHAHQEGHVTLHRTDLVSAFNHRSVKASEINEQHHGRRGVSYHTMDVEDVKKSNMDLYIVDEETMKALGSRGGQIHGYSKKTGKPTYQSQYENDPSGGHQGEASRPIAEHHGKPVVNSDHERRARSGGDKKGKKPGKDKKKTQEDRDAEHQRIRDARAAAVAARHRSQRSNKEDAAANKRIENFDKQTRKQFSAAAAKKSLNKENDDMGKMEEIFKSVLGDEQGDGEQKVEKSEEKVLIACPHCEKDITRSQVIAKAKAGKADVKKAEPKAEEQKVEKSEKEEKAEEQKEVRKGPRGPYAGSDWFQWVDTGADEAVAEFVAKGQTGMMRGEPPLDRLRDPSR